MLYPVTTATREAWRHAGTATGGMAGSCACTVAAATSIASAASPPNMRMVALRTIPQGYPRKKHRGRRECAGLGKVASERCATQSQLQYVAALLSESIVAVAEAVFWITSQQSLFFCAAARRGTGEGRGAR